MAAKTFILLLVNITQLLLSTSKEVLLSVFEINRHGARTPKYFAERQQKLFFGSQNMQLTINGFRQEQMLGRLMREKYVETLKFLSPDFKPDEFCLVSSPTQRTIFSAAGYLSGLYPNNLVKNTYFNLSPDSNANANDSRNNSKNRVNMQNKNYKKSHGNNNANIQINFNSISDRINNTNENLEIIKDELDLLHKKAAAAAANAEIVKSSNFNQVLIEDAGAAVKSKNNNKIRNLMGERKRLFAPLIDTSSKSNNSKSNESPNNNNTNPSNNIPKSLRSKEKNFSLDILNLKNEDTVPQLHQFTELQRKAVSFLSIHKKEIPLYIDNPLNSRLFHAWKCMYRGELLSNLTKNLKNINPIFNITEEEILKALEDFEKFLQFNEKDFEKKKYKTKKDKFQALVKYYMSYIYHFRLNTNETSLDKQTYKTFKKFILNNWYSDLNSESPNEMKIATSEFFDNILKHFQAGINAHNKTLISDNNSKEENKKINEENKFNFWDPVNKYVKFRVYSGHDTNLVNMLKSLLDSSYIKDNLMRSLDDDNIFKFFIPEFGSYMIFELYYDDQAKNYFVKIIYNGMTVFDGIKTLNVPQENEKSLLKNIRFEKFEELMHHNINKDYERLDCK